MRTHRSEVGRSSLLAGAPARLLLLALPFAAAACSSGPKQRLQTISSWAATAHMAADELQAHHSTWRYSHKTLRIARAQVDKQAKALDPEKLPSDLRAPAAGAIAQARTAIDSLAAVTDRRDRGALAPHSARADSAAQTLDSIVTLIEGQ